MGKEESSAPHPEAAGATPERGLVGAGDEADEAQSHPGLLLEQSVGLDLSPSTYAKQAGKEFLPFPGSGL